MHHALLRHGWQSRQVLESNLHVGKAKDALAAPSQPVLVGPKDKLPRPPSQERDRRRPMADGDLPVHDLLL